VGRRRPPQRVYTRRPSPRSLRRWRCWVSAASASSAANAGNTSPPQCGGMPSTFSRRRHADERIAASHWDAASFSPRQKTKRTGLPNKARRVSAPAAIAALPPHPPLSHGGEREYWVPSPLSRRAPGRGTAPLAGVRLRPWPAAVARGRAANHDDVRFCRSFPRSFAVPQSVPSSAFSAVSALKAVPFCRCRSPICAALCGLCVEGRAVLPLPFPRSPSGFALRATP